MLSFTHCDIVWICEWLAPVKVYFCLVPRWQCKFVIGNFIAMPSAVINVVITLWLLCGKYMLCTVLEIADYSHSSMDGLGWVAISMLKRQVQSAIDAGVPVSLIQRAVAQCAMHTRIPEAKPAISAPWVCKRTGILLETLETSWKACSLEGDF